jgi:hypothetical protein
MGHDYIDAEPDQFGSERGGAVASTFRVTPFDRNVLALDIAERLQTSSEGVGEWMWRCGGHQDADTRHFFQVLRERATLGYEHSSSQRADETAPIDHPMSSSHHCLLGTMFCFDGWAIWMFARDRSSV